MTTSPALDLSHVDAGIRVQDDLFGHVNGAWLDTHEIPADRSTDGAFYALRDAAEETVRTIVEECAADADATGDTARIGALYASFMDTDGIAAAGLAPLADELTEVRWAQTPSDLVTVLGRLQRTGVSGLLGYYVDTDAKRSDRYLVNVVQSGISLPDEAYYREDQYAPVREKFTAHVAATFRLAAEVLEGLVAPGEEDAAAAQVLELETAIAAGHWDVVARRDADKGYNLRTFAELSAEAPGVAPAAWVAAVTGAEESTAFAEVNVRQPSFATHAANLLADRPLAQWRTWLAWRVLHARSPFLTDALVDEHFAFYGTVLTGTPEIRDRWKRGVTLVEQYLGFAVGELYTARHFPADSKERMQALVADLVEAYRRRITDLPWMTPATRERALEKLGKFTPKIGYPDVSRDYSALEVRRDDLVGNLRRGEAFEHDREFAKIGAPVDRDEWFMTPQTVNAYYNPGMNEIVFPAAILQPPFFSPTADDAVNYGGIGAVIGHEIGHGFDDQGAKYDGDGNLEDWWTDADREEFGKRTTALIEQYDALVPRELAGEPGGSEHHVNGGFTVGENIGDLGGLGIALVAYAIARERAGGTVDDDATRIDDLTGLQRLFFSWGVVWRGKSRPEEAIRRLAIDPHSPAEFRCNAIVSNLDEFYTAFGVDAGDRLFLDRDRRVSIWGEPISNDFRTTRPATGGYPGCDPVSKRHGERVAVHSRKQSGEQLPSVLGVVHESPEVPLEELTLSERMGEIARLLREQSGDSESLLTAATQFAVDQVPGADFACVTLVDPKGGISHPVVIGEEAQRVADVQRDLEEGPSVGATFESTTILLLEDTATDDRWPRFAAAAKSAGVGSILSFCLYVQNDAYGTLDLMAREAHAFDAESISIGSLYAVHAAVAFSAVREKEQIRAALTTRDVIGQAKGMIMERYKLDSDAAFRLLARLSQDSNVRLAEVAEQVIEAGPE